MSVQFLTSSINDIHRWKTRFDGKQQSMEDDLWLKTTIDGRRPSMEDNHWWTMAIDGRQPSMEDNPQSKTTFDWRGPLSGWFLSIKDDLLWMITFNVKPLARFCEIIFYMGPDKCFICFVFDEGKVATRDGYGQPYSQASRALCSRDFLFVCTSVMTVLAWSTDCDLQTST